MPFGDVQRRPIRPLSESKGVYFTEVLARHLRHIFEQEGIPLDGAGYENDDPSQSYLPHG